MESNAKTNRQPFLIKIAEQLMRDQEDLDHLALQLSLGKAEAKEQFEEVKKKLRGSIHDFKVELLKEYNKSETWVNSLKDKLSKLDEKLAEAKADTREKFTEQKESILKAIEEIRNDITNSDEAKAIADFYSGATEKMKLEMEILGKKWDEAQANLSENFKNEMLTAKFKIKSIVEKAKDKKDDLDEKFSDFSDEMQEAYMHLKRAIKAL